VLGIETKIVQARAFQAKGKGEDRVFDLLGKLNATALLNGPIAEPYSSLERYRDAGISLSFKVYDYSEYQQENGPFEAGVTILDLLFHCGEKAKHLINSQTPPREVVTI